MARNNLMKILIEEGIKQSQLAIETGISQGTINKIANQKRSGSPTTRHSLVNGINKISRKNYSHENLFPNDAKYN